MDLVLLERLNEERAARRAVILVTELESGAQRIVSQGEMARDPLGVSLEEGFRTGRSRLIEHDGQRVFLKVQVPPPRLVITGAVHISQALYPMAKAVGLDVVIIDPRTAFATPERFPDVELRAEWPQHILSEVALDPYTAVAALTHDPRIDDAVLAEALAQGCFYVGALGSRRTHASRLERLGKLGVADETLDRIRAPIGLDIGAVSPSEIAVSVLAEIIASLRRPGFDGKAGGEAATIARPSRI